MRLILIIISFIVLFSEGISQIRFVPVNGKLAFIKPYYPNLITEPKYESIEYINEKTFIVSRNGKVGIVDSTGNEILKADTYNHFHEITDYNTNEKFYQFEIIGTFVNCLVNKNGKVVAKNFYQVEKKFNELLLVTVSKDDSLQKKLFFTTDDRSYTKNGILDLDGNWIAKPDNREYSFTSKYYFYAYDHNRQSYHDGFMLLDRRGKAIINEPVQGYDINKPLPDSLRNAKKFYVQTDEYRWLIDSTGKIISKFQRPFPGVYLNTNDKGKWGAFQNDKWIINPAYNEIEDPNNYIFAANWTNHTTDIYDRRGKLLVKQLPYHKIYATGGPYVSHEGKQYFVGQSAKGNVLLNDKFAAVSQPQREIASSPLLYNDNDSVVFDFQSFPKLYGVMNRYGKIIIAAQYKERVTTEGSIIKMQNANKLYDLYDQTGKLLMKGVADIEISYIDLRFYFIKKNDKQAVYTLDPFKEVTIPNAYTSLVEITGSKLTMAVNDDKKYLLDKNFKLATTTAYKSILKDKHNDSTLVLVDFNGKMQFINSRVNKINSEIDEFDTYSGSGMTERFLVWKNKKYGIFNAFGKTLLAPEWDTIINAGKAVILKKDNNYFLADTNFTVNKTIAADSIISIEYGEAFAYRKNNKWHFFNDENTEFDKIVYATRKDFIEVKSNGKTGVYNMTKKAWVLKPVFDTLPDARNTRTPNETLFTVKKGKQNYIVDAIKGTIKPDAYSFIESVNYMIDAPVPFGIDNFIVYKDADKPNTGKFGIMNYKGELLHPLDGDYIMPMVLEYYDLGWASSTGMLWNKGGTKSKYISNPSDSAQYESVDENGNASMKYTVTEAKYDEKIVGGKFGIVNSQGKEILPVIYDDIQFMYTYNRRDRNARRSFSDSAFDRTGDKLMIYPVFLKKDKKYGAADLSGKILIPVEYDSIADFKQGEKDLMQVWKNKNFGIFDLYGKELLPTEITYQKEYKLNYYNPGMTLYQKGGTVTNYTIVAQERDETRYLPETGDEIVVTTKDTIELQQLLGGKFGLFDQDSFKWFLNPEYDDIRFNQVFNVDRTDKIIKLKATEKFTYRPEFILRDSLTLFEIKKADKWGVYQLKKGIVVQPVYEDVDALQATSSVKIKQTGKWGVISLSGTIILKPEFDEITLLEESMYKTSKAGTIQYYNLEGKVTEAK